MIKLNASLSKKVPIAGMGYSSQSFMAGLEVELSDSAALAEVQKRIREVYSLLEDSINEQIAARQQQVSAVGQLPESSGRALPDYQARNNRHNYRENSCGNNRQHQASQAQLKAISAISHEQGIDENALTGILRQNFRKEQAGQLTLREASNVISLLKGLQKRAG